jgi:hypothetical protein
MPRDTHEVLTSYGFWAATACCAPYLTLLRRGSLYLSLLNPSFTIWGRFSVSYAAFGPKSLVSASPHMQVDKISQPARIWPEQV